VQVSSLPALIIIELMAELVFQPTASAIAPIFYMDDACGTGGMLTVGEAKLLPSAEGRARPRFISTDRN